MLLTISAILIVLVLIKYYGLPEVSGGFAKQIHHVIIYCYLWAWKRKWAPMFRFKHQSRDLQQLGIKSLPEAERHECPRPLLANLNAMDSIGFCGSSNDGNALFIRIIRRNERCCEIIVYLKMNTGDEYEHPVHPDSHVYNTNGSSFSAGGLTFDVLEPLFRWRITYNGLLRKIQRQHDNNKAEVVVPVKFSFIWHPMNNYIGFPHDFDTGIMAKTMTEHQTTKNFDNLIASLKHLTQAEEWSEQFGHIHGNIGIDGQDETILLLRGLKDRKHGIRDWTEMKRSISIKGVTENGTAFHFFKNEHRNNTLLYGYVCAPCVTIVRHVNGWPNDIGEFMDKDHFRMSVKAGDREYKLEMELYDDGVCVYHGADWNYRQRIRIFRITFNGKLGYAFMETGYPVNERQLAITKQRSLPHLKEPGCVVTSQLVVPFDDLACQSSKLVGGKGSSLALMTSLDQKWLDQKFEVPSGVCIQKLAFEQHLNKFPNLKTGISTLEDVAWQRIKSPLIDECKRIVELVEATQITNSLKNQLEQMLRKKFGDEFESIRFAVRSSAIGEDGEEMSAAGQNETFLGVRGLEEISLAIVKCWASQFSHRSIEYKRQNGQLLNGGMSVVVQQMVPADVAGVLFTHHPVTGSRANLLISSNYGLGESVVSGSADPDTILLKRSWKDELDIFETQIGEKKIQITMSEQNGVIETEIDSTHASKCTLTEQMALRLGKIAIYLEQSWGSARDIEWAIKGDKIYLLQSRPVTSDNIMTEFEIFHEFDSSSPTDVESYTTANVSEVLPGAITPLTVSTIMRLFCIGMVGDNTWKHLRHRYDPTAQEVLDYFCGHLFLSRIKEKFWTMGKEKSGTTKAMEIGFFGRVLDDDDVQQLAVDRAENPPSWAYFHITICMIKGMLFGKRIIDNAERRFGRYPEAGNKALTSRDIYRLIEESLPDVTEVIQAHCKITFGSTAWNMLVFSTLSQGDDDYSMEIYSDFAMLVGNSNGAESGDAPLSIMKLIDLIAKDMNPKDFAKMTPEEGLTWIENNSAKSKQIFDEFMERHGHRCTKEMDLGAISWDMEPEKLIKVCQDMLRNYNPNMLNANKESQKTNDVTKEIKTQLSSIRKFMLPFVLNGSKNGICGREKSKSLLVKVIDGFRKAYRHLARLMVIEGHLPEDQLIFYMTHEEIGQVLDTRSAKIIRRAQHRKRIHPKMDKLKFPELFAGFPKPIEEDDVNLEGLLQVSGYPVSSGKIKAPCRVIHHFDEVHLIQPGDILITHATDIGWSPYFPMLAGVVTEIGGLISHGAVVAREFGLPCVIGTQNATKIFKSGEIVLLDAFKGIVAKVDE